MLKLQLLGRNIKNTITKIILVIYNHQKPIQIALLLPNKMWKPYISQMMVTYQKPERKKQKITEKQKKKTVLIVGDSMVNGIEERKLPKTRHMYSAHYGWKN